MIRRMSEDSKPPSVLAALPLGCGPPYNGIRLSANSGPAPDRPYGPCLACTHEDSRVPSAYPRDLNLAVSLH
jgi:hypothetical protein